MSSASITTAAFTRLQDDLRLGLTCVKEIWNYEAKDWITGVHAADINQDGDIEVLAGSRDGRVCALTRDGHSKWEKIIGDKRSVTAIVACPAFEQQPACVIISTLDGKIYVLNQQGDEIPPPGSDAAAPTYWFDVGQTITQMWMDASLPLTVVFAADDRCAYSLDIARNQLRWRFSTPANDPMRVIFTYDVDGDGLPETLIGSDNKMLYLLSSTGKLLSSCQMDQAIYALFAADIDRDGKVEILVGTRTKKLFILDSDLHEKWMLELSSRPLAISVTDMNKDRQPEILVACDDQSLSILDNTGKIVWREQLGKRYHSLNTFDLDRDGYIEILAGADDSRVYALRIQLSKGLDKKIQRDYKTLGKPDITSLPELTSDQIDLLLGVLGTTYGSIDKKLNLITAQEQMDAGLFTEALLSLLKLDQQKFQLLWEKDKMGYRRALCLPDLKGDKRLAVVVSSLNGGLSAFNAQGRLLWTEESPDGSRIFDAQSGYLSPGHGEDVAFATDTGSLALRKPGKIRSVTTLSFPEPAACFYLLAPNPASTFEMLIGTNNGKTYLYTNDLETPAHIFNLSATIQRVYASEHDEGGKYRNPELLISTAENMLFAYTRGGNRLWAYPTRSPILALCAKDLDNDGRLEVLIGTEDRNIYVLDDEGSLRWRYVLPNRVLALETADIDNDGNQEILAGCADGILYVFTSAGDLTWRYTTKDKDPIQALRVADIDLDGNVEIVMVEENHLEVLQVLNRQDLNTRIAICWERLLTNRDPLDALLPLIKGSEPHLRASGLLKLAMLNPLPSETFDLLNNAAKDSFTSVRRILPEASMHAFPADPIRARSLLHTLFTEPLRDVRIEVIERLELLASYDWNTVYFYLEKALDSDERTTRRAALRKISRLLRDFAADVKDSQIVLDVKGSQITLAEALFRLMFIAAQDKKSNWVKQEAGRVLADFLNLFEDDFLPYLYRLFANRLTFEALEHTASNLASSPIRQTVVNLLALKFEFTQTDAVPTLASATDALKVVSQPRYAYSTDLWLICHELLTLSQLSNIEDLASYEFLLKPEQFRTAAGAYPYTQLFLHIGNQLSTIMRPLKTFLRRTDPNDRLNSLTESVNALEIVNRLVDREYGVSPLPGTPQPYLPEFVILKTFGARWQEMFNTQRNELRGHPELKCDLRSRTVHLEETVGLWLQITNYGRAPARQVKITLLADKSFTVDRTSQSQTFEIEVILAGQDTGAEFLLKPATDSVTLTFEITYEDAEHELRTTFYQERLDFIERPPTFTPIENPYTTGTPLHDGRMCYGREASLAYLQDNLTRTTAQSVVVLYGQRRSGKTTLLNQLAKTDLLAQHVAVMIDLQKLIYNLNLNKFLFGISRQIYEALNKRGLSILEPQRKDFFDPSEDPQFSFERFLDQVEICMEDRQLILLFDEFEELEEQVKQGNLKSEIFKYLRSLMQERHYFHFLFSGTHQIENLTRDYWSVFFNIALHHRLASNISSEGAVELITRPVAGFLEYEPQVVNKIRALTADQPYLIHLVCRVLVNHCNKMQRNYATINDVNLVLEDVLTTGTVHFEWLWERFKKTEQILLQVIAEGGRDEGRPLDQDDIRKMYEEYYHSYQPDDVTASLKTLWAEDVIAAKSEKQQGGISDTARYTFTNGLFRQWIKEQKPLRRLKQAQEQKPLVLLAENQNPGSYNTFHTPTAAHSPEI